MVMVEVKSAGTIRVSSGNPPNSLFQHQNLAIQELDKYNLTPFEGLLVLPTGGGKTLTAVHWLLKNFIDKNKKVLWIAHRHELLNQAFETIKSNAYSVLLNNRTEFRYRIISGSHEHDKPVNVKISDDIIIASKDSLNVGINYLLEQWINNLTEVLLVVDEAHHATAKTYRKLISELKEKVNTSGFRMLGLTATPFRTAESEKGLLLKVFPDNIIFKEDLRNLITRGILAEPIFKELLTKLEIYRELQPKDINAIQAFDKIPGHIAKKIAESSSRNNQIVEHYLRNLEKYQQLLVFAIDIDHAITLNALFNQKGIKSVYVLSDFKDGVTGATIRTAKENSDKIQKFRDGEINVLVNVNIITEGVDLPSVQTVFLTRPTTSTILMTQMIGRALRGKNAGGTENAYIVSFIDEWKDKINWVNPEKLTDYEGTFDDNTREVERQIARLISIEKMEEFARIMNDTYDTTGIENLEFLKRIPLGIYRFSILESLETQNDLVNKNYEVLLYDDTEQAYDNFINDLEYLFEEVNLCEREVLTEYELKNLFSKVKEQYFTDFETLIGYRDEDLKNILRYYAQKEGKPDFLAFKSRQQCNLAKVAHYAYDNDLGLRARTEYENSLWEDDKAFWQVLFGYDKRYFLRQLDIEIRKITSVEPQQNDIPVSVDTDRVDINTLPLYLIKEKDFGYYKELRDGVYAEHTNSTGVITCAISRFRSRRRIDFQIDHKKPMSQGGLSTLDNLQILSRPAHAQKTWEENLVARS